MKLIFFNKKLYIIIFFLFFLIKFFYLKNIFFLEENILILENNVDNNAIKENIFFNQFKKIILENGRIKIFLTNEEQLDIFFKALINVFFEENFTLTKMQFIENKKIFIKNNFKFLESYNSFYNSIQFYNEEKINFSKLIYLYIYFGNKIFLFDFYIINSNIYIILTSIFFSYDKIFFLDILNDFNLTKYDFYLNEITKDEICFKRLIKKFDHLSKEDLKGLRLLNLNLLKKLNKEVHNIKEVIEIKNFKESSVFIKKKKFLLNYKFFLEQFINYLNLKLK